MATYIYPPNGQVGKAAALCQSTYPASTPAIILPCYNSNTVYAYNANGTFGSFTGAPASVLGATGVAPAATGYGSWVSTWYETASNLAVLGNHYNYAASGAAYLNGVVVSGSNKPYISSFGGEIYTYVSGTALSNYAAIASGSVGLGLQGPYLVSLIAPENLLCLYNTNNSTYNITLVQQENNGYSPQVLTIELSSTPLNNNLVLGLWGSDSTEFTLNGWPGSFAINQTTPTLSAYFAIGYWTANGSANPSIDFNAGNPVGNNVALQLYEYSGASSLLAYGVSTISNATGGPLGNIASFDISSVPAGSLVVFCAQMAVPGFSQSWVPYAGFQAGTAFVDNVNGPANADIYCTGRLLSNGTTTLSFESQQNQAGKQAAWAVFGGTPAPSYTSIPISNIQQAMDICVNYGYGTAVVGTRYGPLIASGATNVAVAPNGLLAAFANPSNNKIALVQGPDPNWVNVNTLTPGNSPYWAAWNNLSTQVLFTNTGAANISIYSVSNSTLALFQTLTIPASGATQIVGIPNTTQAVYCNPSNNYVEFINFSAGAWSILQQVAFTTPSSVYAPSSTSAVVGVASGAAFLTYSSSSWSTVSTVVLPFTPSSIYQDSNGVTYAAGTGSGYGWLAAIAAGVVTQVVNWSGSGNAVYWQQGQIFVSDATNKLIRGYYLLNGNLYPEATTSVPAGWLNFSSAGITIFGCTSTAIYQHCTKKPFTVAPIPYGWSIVYNGSWGSPAFFSVPFEIPSAVIWNASGYVNVATTANNLYTVNGATILASGAVKNYNNTVYNQPIGISDMVWFTDGHLYASTSMNSALLQLQ